MSKLRQLQKTSEMGEVPTVSLLNLHGKKGLVIGIANEQSIAYGCASVFHAVGAELALTYHNSKTMDAVQSAGKQWKSKLVYPCDVQNELQMLFLFEAIQAAWGKLNFLVHSIAYAPKADLHGRVTDCSSSGFLTAMDISCHSFVRMAHYAEPLMRDGGSLLTISYYGAERVVANYNIMGPVKAALESVVRYMAAELGPKNIRVNAISPGVMRTRAASGLENLDAMLSQAVAKAPLHRTVDLADVGNMATFLVSDLSKNVTGGVHYVDAGYEVVD